jgi:propionate CoA-transferase
VERIAQAGSLDAQRVQVPGVLVDCVVLAQPENHWQTYGVAHNGAYSGQFGVPLDRVAPLPLDERKVMARRAALELPMGGVVNLGIGMPEGVAAEERILRYVTLTAEPGVIGGMPQGGLNFGAALNREAVIQQNQQFDFYDVGGLDLAVLGMAQVDGEGNVDVSRLGPRLAGAGGFINISQNARKVVFTGAFTAGGLVTAIEDGRLRIVQEGRSRKFIEKVEQITFSGGFAGEAGQPVLYVTERRVLRRSAEGVELIEVAPGIDIDAGILAHMGFRPIMRDPKLMDERLFQLEPMRMEHILLGLSLAERISFDAERNTLFINYEGFQIRTTDDVELVRRQVESRCKAIGHRIAVVVKYDGFTLDPMVSDAFFSMITYLQQRYYTSASRYTTNAFMRLKLGASLAERALAPYFFETLSEAQAFAGSRAAAVTVPSGRR